MDLNLGDEAIQRLVLYELEVIFKVFLDYQSSYFFPSYSWNYNENVVEIFRTGCLGYKKKKTDIPQQRSFRERWKSCDTWCPLPQGCRWAWSHAQYPAIT